MATELTVLGQPATLQEPLGRGATGEVWLARGESGESFVLKFARDRQSFARLAEEAQRLLGVDSPWCVRLLGAGKLGQDLELPSTRGALPRGTPFLVLEHHLGVPLRELHPTSEEARARWLIVVRDVGRALADLHATGVAHGDVKPDNVLLEERPGGARARLVDFGLSGASDEVAARGGTRRYLAPEVFEPAGGGDARHRDLFALGATLAELARDWHIVDPNTEALSRALTSRAPGARPSAGWAFRRAFELLGESESQDERRERRRGAVRRTYLAQRRSELVSAARDPRSRVVATGQVAEWLEAALALSRSVEELRGSLGAAESMEVGDLGPIGRARWLVALVGPEAAAWPELPVTSDDSLAERLLAAVETKEPLQLSFGDVETPGAASVAAPDDPVELALALGRGAASQGLLDAAERAAPASAPLAVAVGRAFRLRGQLGRALSVLERVPGPMARIEAAEVQRRAGDGEAALALLGGLDETGLDADLRARAVAIRARLLLDRGEARQTLRELERASVNVSVLEVQALAQIALGERDRARAAIERALLLAETDEERARAEAVAGNLAHFEGDSERALQCFRRASEHAARAGAVLEEATYLTGAAANASNVGELGLALSSARRALLLFESLGRPREAARALLSLGGAHTALGSVIEARDALFAASQRAKWVGDKRCRAYAHLGLADIAQPGDPEAVEHARLAATLLVDDADDQLRAMARLHAAGAAVDHDALDRQATAEGARDARLEWWTARARVACTAEKPIAQERVLEALLAFVGQALPSSIRGPAFAAGAELAARAGDGDAVRRLTLAASEAARELLGRAGTEAAASIRLLGWVRLAESGSSSIFSPEQLADVDRLIRALGRRDSLRPLLEQVVDALVLWTGVERGLLLLRAPGGRLRPRAARNLLRADLTGAQLELSHSLAERALALGEPVIAVDAEGDLPEVHASVHALKLRSVLAVPLIARGEAFGVVYLDDRVRRGAFGPRELAWVRLVATLAAVALADARDQILLRRAVRRARRAEARVAGDLARREAELDVAERELARARDARDTRFSYDEIVGQSEALRGMLRLVDRVSSSEVPVLITGESGSGKELVGRAIHKNGPRGGQPFVAENCGAIPEPLLESTLFGHVRGAFTGADRPRAGLFEVAHRGTLFLDEIGEMSLAMQAKLLRAVQDGEIHPVGSERSRRVDVRVIGATHRDLEAMVASGQFREDLYYRLNVIRVRIPSLRERIGDVALLVKHFVGVHASGGRVQISKAALDRLIAYPWPGNVRQLENEVRRALVLSDGVVLPEHLSPNVASRSEVKSIDELNLRQRIDALESELVRIALRRTEGNQTRAAELLGVSRFGLQKMMKRLEISLSSLS